MGANGTSLKSDVVTFIPNIPVQVAVKYATPKIIAGKYGQRAFFSLTDGRAMFVDVAVGEQIVEAAVRTGEPFWICLRWDGGKFSPKTWDIWLDIGAEKARAVEERPDGFEIGRAHVNRAVDRTFGPQRDRKSTRLNSSHLGIS